MNGPRSGDDEESNTSSDDALLRSIARAPPRAVPQEPASGTPWGATGRYVVEQCLGRGGMGTVYVASDALLSRKVALKVLFAGDGDEDAGQRVRLLREARLAARIEHDRVARIYDVGEHEGSAFVAMEYVRGVTLRAWTRECARSPAEILRVIRQVAEGLSVLHANGVIHRDLKPENVMMPALGGVKLVDFGLARSISLENLNGAGAPPDAATGASVGQLSGTPGYMAPEQCRGEPIEAAADVFALGVVFYELVTGGRPFRRETTSATIRATLEETPGFDGPEWDRFWPGARGVAKRMLQQRPADRIRDGRAAVEAILAIESAAGEQPTAPLAAHVPQHAEAPAPPRAPRGRRVARVALPVVTLLALTAAGLVVSKRARPRQPARPPVLSGMVWLEGGTFTMGRAPEEISTECERLGHYCRHEVLEREQPARRVTLSPFFMDQTETTNAEFAAWLNIDPNRLIVEVDPDHDQRRYVKSSRGVLLLDLWPDHLGVRLHAVAPLIDSYEVRPGYERKPVIQVTWDGARLYCEARGKRLPTEAEWEFAARGRTARRYPWGDDEPRCGDVVFGRNTDGPCAASTPELEDVDSGSQDWTPEHIHGLGGNASEWVSDAFTLPFYPACGDCVDPRVEYPADAGEDLRVVRGGAWSNVLMSRATTRGRWNRYAVADNFGFRCAADSPK